MLSLAKVRPEYRIGIDLTYEGIATCNRVSFFEFVHDIGIDLTYEGIATISRERQSKACRPIGIDLTYEGIATQTIPVHYYLIFLL